MQKHEWLIAGVATIFVVVFIAIFGRRQPTATVVANGSVTPSVAVPATDDSGSYIGYNIPPFNPGALPDISNLTLLDSSTHDDHSTGTSCCPTCAGINNIVQSGIGLFKSALGLGTQAGSSPIPTPVSPYLDFEDGQYYNTPDTTSRVAYSGLG